MLGNLEIHLPAKDFVMYGPGYDSYHMRLYITCNLTQKKQIISAEHKIPLPFHLQMSDERFEDYACLRDFKSRIGFTPIEVIPYSGPPVNEEHGNDAKSGFSVGS